MANEVVIIDKAEIDVFRSEGSTAVDHAKTLARAICDAATLDTAARFMLSAKERVRRIGDRLKGPKEDARKAWKNWCDLENELVEPYDRIEREIIKPAMAQFQQDEDRKRRMEEDRLRAEAKKREEDARLKEAEELEKNGDAELAEAVLSTPVVVAPVVLPRTETPAGISYRDVWKYRVLDDTKVPREYLMLDERRIGAVVRALKGETKIAGIEAYSEKTVAGRIS